MEFSSKFGINPEAVKKEIKKAEALRKVQESKN